MNWLPFDLSPSKMIGGCPSIAPSVPWGACTACCGAAACGGPPGGPPGGPCGGWPPGGPAGCLCGLCSDRSLDCPSGGPSGGVPEVNGCPKPVLPPWSLLCAPIVEDRSVPLRFNIVAILAIVVA